MSIDVSVHTEGCCATHSHQFTYNYTPALREVGFPSWDMIDSLPASVVSVMINRVIFELSNPHRREHYAGLIKGGGEWGTMDTLIESLRALNHDLMRHPLGTVST